MPSPIVTPPTRPITEVPGPAAARRVAHQRTAGAEREDRHRQHRDPWREQPGAGGVVRGDLGRQRDVRHLEDRERRRRGDEGEHHPVAAPAPSSARGVANTAANSSGSVSAPVSRKLRRLPCRAAEVSDRAPMNGSMTTSQSFGTVTTSPAIPAATPSVSVR